MPKDEFLLETDGEDVWWTQLDGDNETVLDLWLDPDEPKWSTMLTIWRRAQWGGTPMEGEIECPLNWDFSWNEHTVSDS